MEYYVVYDNEDNIICYLDNLFELNRFLPNYRLRDLKRRFKNNEFIRIIVDKSILNVYKFC